MKSVVFFPLGGLLALTGCSSLSTEPALSSQDLVQELELPSQWSTQPSRFAPAASRQWWQQFGSADLNQLIEQAHRQSLDLKLSAERIRQAELQVAIQDSSFWPTASATAATSSRRSETSERSASTSRSSSLGLSVSYEVDLWGRLNAASQAAQASLAASQYDQVAARLSLEATLSQTYFQLQALNYRLDIADNNVRIVERTLKIVQARYQNGTATALDVSRQQTSLLTQQASLLPLQLQIRQTRSAIALLLGQAPDNLQAFNDEFEGLQSAPIAASLPSDLLFRRPDLARLEAQLEAARANIQVARAALLPSLQLTGSTGLASQSLLSLANPTHTLSLGASLAQTLFDHGKNQANIDLARSRQQELVYSYQQAVLTALNEVEDALKSLATNQAQRSLQRQVVAEAEKTLSLAELRYQSGADELLSVLDAQRTLFQAKDQLAQLRLNQLIAQANLFKALGGGWQKPAETTLDDRSQTK